jgi:ribonuclease E
VAQLWQPPAPAAPQSEPSPEPATSPRRRSTVREAAPVSLGEMSPAAAPIPEPPPEAAPAAASAEPEEDARPRRSGWWSRRVFGKG